MEPYDLEHLNEARGRGVFERVLDQLYAPAEWKAVVEYGDLVVEAREVERAPALTVYRGGLDLDVPLHFAVRSVVAQSRACEVNAYTKSQEEIARLKNPDPSDPDGMGAVIVFDHQQLIYSWRVNTVVCFANRRLRDGSCLAVKVAIDRRADGVWSTRRFLEKSFALSYWHVRPTPSGCRLTYSWQEKATLPIVRFFAPSIVRQIFARSTALNIFGFQRVILSDLAAAGGAGRAPKAAGFRPRSFASGSASAPAGLGAGLGTSLEGPDASPFVVLSCRPAASAAASAGDEANRALYPSAPPSEGPAQGKPPERRPPAPAAGLAPVPSGVIPGDWTSSGLDSPDGPLALSAQMIEEDFRTAPDPFKATLFGEAVRASMDLSVHLERLYVSGAASPLHAPRRPLAFSAASGRRRRRRRRRAQGPRPPPPRRPRRGARPQGPQGAARRAGPAPARPFSLNFPALDLPLFAAPGPALPELAVRPVYVYPYPPAPPAPSAPSPRHGPPLGEPSETARAEAGSGPPAPADEIFEGPEVFKADCSVAPAPASQQLPAPSCPTPPPRPALPGAPSHTLYPSPAHPASWPPLGAPPEPAPAVGAPGPAAAPDKIFEAPEVFKGTAW
eukprot:tig00021532_g22192.t1